MSADASRAGALDGRGVAVTGGTSGIGLAVATGADIAGHAVLKAAKGKGEDGKK